MIVRMINTSSSLDVSSPPHRIGALIIVPLDVFAGAWAFDGALGLIRERPDFGASGGARKMRANNNK